jgi:hypothetical protein
MKDKKINIFKILLYTVYIFSIAFFVFKREYGEAGLSSLCLVITFVLSKAYSKNLTILDRNLYIVGNLFILSSFLLGSSYHVYDKIKYYDDFLHFVSGFISVKIGWNVLKVTKEKNIVSKILIFIVIFFFSIGISGIGELSEYILDTLFNMDTQPGGLKDTMQDMIDALVGAFIMIIYYYKK